jgi:hypothetical protein
MATTIDYPQVFAREDTRHINNIEFPYLYIQADDASVNKYCAEQDPAVTMASYEQDEVRVSNDGARLYNYYDSARGEWLNSWGYSPIVVSITTT